jgi:hypothetical protein
MLSILYVISLFSALTHVNNATSNTFRLHRTIPWLYNVTFGVECLAFAGGMLHLNSMGLLDLRSIPVLIYAGMTLAHWSIYPAARILFPGLYDTSHDLASLKELRFRSLGSWFSVVIALTEALCHLWFLSVLSRSLEVGESAPLVVAALGLFALYRHVEISQDSDEAREIFFRNQGQGAAEVPPESREEPVGEGAPRPIRVGNASGHGIRQLERLEEF